MVRRRRTCLRDRRTNKPSHERGARLSGVENHCGRPRSRFFSRNKSAFPLTRTRQSSGAHFSRRGWLRSAPVLLAVGLQAALLMVTVFVVVLVPPSRTEPEFAATHTVSLPQRELEHRASFAEFQQATSRPALVERLAVDALLPDALPPLPSLPQSEFNPMETTDFIAQDAQALLGQSGLMETLQRGGEGSAASFFGIEDVGERIVIIVNTSVSVVNKAERRGVTIERIQEEMISLVEGLGSRSLFGIVQFSQGVRRFEDFLAPATGPNKEALGRWVPDNLRGNPRARPDQLYYGHEAAFEAAFELEPDVIFLLTDGQLNRREGVPGEYSYPRIPYSELMGTIRQLREGAGRNVRIHAVCFEMREADATGMRRLTREFGGELREF